MANDFTSLFQPQSIEASKTNSNEYRVSFRQGRGGVYDSIIRFVVNWENPQRCIIAKGVSYLKNPITGIGRYIDDPKTVNEPSPCREFFSTCWNTNNEAVQNFAKKNCSTKDQYASLIQVIKDDQHPELVGKILVMTYGVKVWSILNEEEHSTTGGTNPFHPIYGRYFHIKCTSQGGYNDFSQSNFFDNKVNNTQLAPSGLWYIDPANPSQFSVVTEETDQQVLYEYLKANSPSLAPYEYRPWDAETANYVNETLALFNSYLQAGKIPSAAQGGAFGAQGIPAMQQTQTPMFPGSTQTPAAGFGLPSAPAAPAGFGLPSAPAAPAGFAPSVPSAPAAPAGFAPQAPAAPAGFAPSVPSMPTAPAAGFAPSVPSAPAAPAAGFGLPSAPAAPVAPVTLGGVTMGAPTVGVQAPSVSGVELPNTGSQAPSAPVPTPTQAGIGGSDLESVLAGL